MSATNFSQYQKKVCDIAPEPPPLKKLCPECKPNPSYIPPDWRNIPEETYLDEAACEYRVCVTINSKGDSFTARQFRDQVGEGKKYPTREHLFRTFIQPAITIMLEDLDKLIAKQIICSRHSGPVVAGSSAVDLIQKYDNFHGVYMDLKEDPLNKDEICPDLFSPTVFGDIGLNFEEPVSFTQLVLNSSPAEINNPFALELYARVIEFDIDPMQNLLKVLVSIPAFILDSVPDNPTAEDIRAEAATIKKEVELDVSKLFAQVTRLKTALMSYSAYQSYFYQTQDGFLKFKESGKDFYCSSYSGKISGFYDDLKAICKEKKWNIRSNIPSIIIKNADKIKIEFTKGENGNPYKIKKISAKIEGCEYQRVVGANSKFAKKYSNKPTLMNYIAKLEEIDTALRARESYPWLDFCVKFTYPLLTVHYGTLNEESVRDSMGDCVANNALDFGGDLKDYILNEALSLMQSIAYEFNSKQNCTDLLAEDEIEKKYFKQETFTPGLDAKRNLSQDDLDAGVNDFINEDIDQQRKEMRILQERIASMIVERGEFERERDMYINFISQGTSDNQTLRDYKRERDRADRSSQNLTIEIDKTNEKIKKIKSSLIAFGDELSSTENTKKRESQVRRNVAKTARKTSRRQGSPYWKDAKAMALEEIKTQDTLLSNLVDLETFMTTGELNFSFAKKKEKSEEKDLLERMTLCNFKGLTIAAVRCLFSGVSQEAAFKKIVESALNAMDIDIFGFFIQGLPPDKQTELRKRAKQQWDNMPMPWEEVYVGGSTEKANPYLNYLGTNKGDQGVEAKRREISERVDEKKRAISVKQKDLDTLLTKQELPDTLLEFEQIMETEKGEIVGSANDIRFGLEQEISVLEMELKFLEKEKENIENELNDWPMKDGKPVPFSQLSEDRQKELKTAQQNTQGTIGKSMGDLQQQIISAYIENIMDVMEIDELMSYLDRFPGGQLVQRYINKVSCSYQGLHNPPLDSFLSTLSFDPCGEGNTGLSIPDKAKDFKMPELWSKNFLKILRNKFIEKFETVVTKILVKMILKLIETVDNALCKSLNVVGQAASNLLSGKALGMDEAFRDAFCPDADQNELDQIKKNAFNNALGKPGGLNNPNPQAYDCLFETINATMSKQEVIGLLTNTPSNMDDSVVTRMSQLVNSRCKELSDVLGDPEDIKDVFASIGKFIPPELRKFLKDQAQELPESPIFDSICLTQQELDNWNQARKDLYLDNGLDEDTANELINKANERALKDLGTVSDMLQKGPGGMLEDALEALLKQADPECSADSSAFVMEDEEQTLEKLDDLNDYFKRIEKVFIGDLIEGKNSILNNILIDTHGFSLKRHQRRTDNQLIYPNYVDTEEQLQQRIENNPFQIDVPVLGGFPHDLDKMRGTFPETVGGAMLDKMKDLSLKYSSVGSHNVKMHFQDNPDEPEFESTLKFKILRAENPILLVKVDEVYNRRLSRQERKRLDLSIKEASFGVEVPNATSIKVKMFLPDELKQNINYNMFIEHYDIETILFRNLLMNKAGILIGNSSLSKIQKYLDSWNQKALRATRDSIVSTPSSEIPTGFSFGADEQQKVDFFDLLYVNPEANPKDKTTWKYNKLPSDKILGKSATEHPRVHFLDPAEHGGSYMFPKIYIEPATYNGWLGMVKVFIPEIEICEDVDNGFLQIRQISKRVKKIESSLPIDKRLSQAPECRFEIPYDRHLTPANHAMLEGIIIATVRTYATEFILKTLPVLGSIRAGSTNFDNTMFSMMSDRMEQEMSIENSMDINVINGYAYYLLFLEQTVQAVQRQIKDGLIVETPEIKQASIAINKAQNNFSRFSFDDPEAMDQIKKGSAIAGYGIEWESKYNKDGVMQKLKKLARFLSPFKLNLTRKLAVIHDTKKHAKIFLNALLSNEIEILNKRIEKNLRPLPHVWDINKYLLSKHGILLGSQIRSGEAKIEAEIVSGASKPDYGSIMNCPDSRMISPIHNMLNTAGISEHGEMFLEKFVKVIDKDGVESIMTIAEFKTLVSSYDLDTLISENFGNANIFNNMVEGTIGIKFGVRLIYVPNQSSGFVTNLNEAKMRVGKIGNYHHIPLATFEHDIIDKKLSEIDFSDENMGEELKCYVDGLVETSDFKLVFGTIIKTKTFTSLFGIYSFHNFFESIGSKEVEEDRVDNIRKKWKRKIFDDTKVLVKKQFRQIYRLDDDDIKKDGSREKLQLDVQFLSNLLPDAYLGLDGSVRWWQSWRIIDYNPFDKDGKSCANDFQNIFKD